MTPELFEAITTWQDEKFKNTTPWDYFKKLNEELIEFSITQTGEEELEELADMAIVFMGLIHKSGFTHRDITEAIANKFAIIRNQEFVFDETTGTHKRVKQ